LEALGDSQIAIAMAYNNLNDTETLDPRELTIFVLSVGW
jgi:hypothetical protein